MVTQGEIGGLSLLFCFTNYNSEKDSAFSFRMVSSLPSLTLEPDIHFGLRFGRRTKNPLSLPNRRHKIHLSVADHNVTIADRKLLIFSMKRIDG